MKKLFFIISAVALFASCTKSNDCLQTIKVYHNDGKNWTLFSEHSQTLVVDDKNANVADNKCLNGQILTDSTKTIISTVCD